MTKKRILVVGTGFQGICDAAQLLKVPDFDVQMVDMAPYFGGILRSIALNGFYVDRGLHLFSGVGEKMHAFLDEILAGKLHPIGSPPASGFSGTITENFDLPDLSKLPEEICKKISSEVKALDSISIDQAKNLSQHLHNRYGPTAGSIFEEIFKKTHGFEAKKVAAREISKTALGRLKFGTDAEMLRLKVSPRLNDILAARRPIETAAEVISSFYPSGGKGMLEFALAAENWLKSYGVKIGLNAKIEKFSRANKKWVVNIAGLAQEFDLIVWSNGTAPELGKLLGIPFQNNDPFLPVSAIFAIFGVNAEDVKLDPYVQLYDPNDVISRVGAGGVFSKQTKKNGSTFITCECPTSKSSNLWKTPNNQEKNIWGCLKKYDLVTLKAAPTWVKILRVPQTLRLQKSGSENSMSEITDQILNFQDSVFFRANPPTFRRDIFAASTHLLDDIKL